MNAGRLLTVGIIGAGAYWIWKRSQPVTTAAGGTAQTSTPPPPPPPPPNPADVRPTTAPTFNTATLLAAAQARGWQDSATPDEWNWLITTDLRLAAFDTDPIFGPVGMASRDAKYTASEFLMYARGGRGHPPGYVGLSGLGAWPVEIGQRMLEVGRPVEPPWRAMPLRARGVPRRGWNYVPRARFLT